MRNMGIAARILCVFSFCGMVVSDTISNHERTIPTTPVDRHETFSEAFQTDPRRTRIVEEAQRPSPRTADLATDNSFCFEEAVAVTELREELQDKLKTLSTLKTSLLCLSLNIPSLRMALEGTLQCCLNGTEQTSDGKGAESLSAASEKDEEASQESRSCWEILNVAGDSVIPKASGVSATCDHPASAGGHGDDQVAALSQAIRSRLQSALELQINVSENPTIQRTVSCPDTIKLLKVVREMVDMYNAIHNVTHVYLSWGAKTSDEKEIDVNDFTPETVTLSQVNAIDFQFRGSGFLNKENISCVFLARGCYSEKFDPEVIIMAEILSDSLLVCVLDMPSVSCQLSVFLSADGRETAQNEVLSPTFNSTVYAPAPEPTIRFSDTGFQMTVTFDRDVKDCYLPTCEDIFENAEMLGRTSECTWHSLSFLEILLGKGDNLVKPGDKLTFTKNTVRAKGENFWIPITGEYLIEPPVSTSHVTAVITGTRDVSVCGEVHLSGERSEGGAGRPLRYHWTCQPSLGQLFVDNFPEVEIDGTLLQPGRIYNFSLEVENFLGDKDTANFQVVRHSEDVPMVTIHSNLDVKQRTTTCSQVVLTAGVTLSPCSGESEVLYEWSTTDPDVQIKTEMVGQPRYVIDKYTLPPGKEVTFTVMVSYKDNADRSSNAQINLKVARQALKAIVKGGNERVVARGNPNLLFDGSLSYDPDRSAGQLTYTWTCEQDDNKPCYSVKDGAQGQIFPFGSANDGPKLVVCGKHFATGRRYNISLTVSKDNRASTSTVDMFVKYGNVPEVSIEPLPPTETNEIGQIISLKAYVTSELEFLASWTIENEFGKELDLSEAIVVSLPTGENNTYVSLLNIDKGGVVGGLRYSVVVVTTDVMNRTAEARLSGVLLGARIRGCVLEVANYTAYQVITLRTSQCQYFPTSSPLTYEYRVLQPGHSKRRLSEKVYQSSARVIGPAPSADHQAIRFSVEVCSDDDVCGTFISDPVSVTMVTQQLEEATNAVVHQVSLNLRKGKFVSALVHLASFLQTARNMSIEDLDLDPDLIMRLVNRTLNSQPPESALSVLVDQLDVLEPDQLGCPKDNRNVYTQLLHWYESNGVSLPYDMHMKINRRLEQIKPGLSETEHLAVSQTLLQTTALGMMKPGQEINLKESNLGLVRALHTLLSANVSSTHNSGVTVDFGPQLQSRYRDWDCGDKSNCNGVIARFVHYNQSQDPFSGSGSPGYSRISDIVDIQLRNPHTGTALEVKNLDDPVVMTFPVMPRSQSEMTCRYWTGSVWSDSGVTTSDQDDFSVQCSASHLTAFAVFGEIAVSDFSPEVVILSQDEKINFEFRGSGFQTSESILCVFAVADCFLDGPDEVQVAAAIRSDTELTCVLDTPPVSCHLSVALSTDEAGMTLSPVYNSTLYAPAPRPSLRFSDTGYQLMVTFDRDVKDCYLPTCEDIFENAEILGRSSKCTWHSLSFLEVLLGKGENLAKPGDKLTFRKGAVRAKGENFWIPITGEYLLEPPVSAGHVTAVITGTRDVSVCGEVHLSGERSEGGAGRPLRYHWTCQPSLGQVFEDDLQQVEIDAALLQPGRTYNFSLEVENFLGDKDTANLRVVRHAEDIPMVTIHSNLDVRQRTTTCSKVVLTAGVTLSPCSGDNEVLYEWSTTNPDVHMKTEMIGQPRYVIDKYTLPPGKEVTFTVTARYKDNADRSSNAQIILKVARQALKAIIRGGSQRVVARGNPNLLFDGSLSYDPDRSAGRLTYTWTCEQDGNKLCYSVKDGAQGQIFPFGSADDGPKLMVCGKHFAAGRRYNISLTVSKDNRTSTSAVDIYVEDGNVPESYDDEESLQCIDIVSSCGRVSIEPLPPTEVNEIGDIISLKAYVTSELEFQASWTIENEFGKKLDLSKASVLSLPIDQNNTYISLLTMDKAGVVGGLRYSVVVVTTDVMNRTAEARLSGVLLSARITGCVLDVVDYTAYQMITLRTSQCQFSPTSSPLTYEYRVQQPGQSERRLSEKIHHPSVRVIGPAPRAGDMAVTFSVEVCSDDDICGTFVSDPVSVAMVPQRQLEQITNAVLHQVSINERKGAFVSALVHLTSFLQTARNMTTDDLGPDLVMRLVNSTLTTQPSASALSVLVDQMDVLEPDELGCPKDNNYVYTQMLHWYEANSVSLPYDLHMKINKRLEQIKPGLSEMEHLAVSQTLLQTTAVGMMRPGQEINLSESNLGLVRALHTLLSANVSSTHDSGVTVDFGPQLQSRYRDWDCGDRSNCNGVIVRFVHYNQSQDPFSGLGSPGHSRISDIVDIQLRNPHTGSVLEVKNLDDPVVMRFHVKSRDQSEATCRYWSGSVWSDIGVMTSQTDDSTVQCSASHLTAFAVFVNQVSTGEEITVSDFSPEVVILSQDEKIKFQFQGSGFQTREGILCVFAVADCFLDGPDEVQVAAAIRSDTELTCVLDTPPVSCHLSVGLSIDEAGSALSQTLSPTYNSTLYAPAPKPSIRFSDTGYQLMITFDRNVKDCYLPTCEDIFENAEILGRPSECTWRSLSFLEILLGKGDNLAKPGDTLVFTEGAVRAKGENFWIPITGDYLIELPVSASHVIAVITGTTDVSVCGEVHLSGERSEGGAGRPLRYHWTCHPSLRELFVDDLPQVEIDPVLLQPDRIYNFSLEVENFLGEKDTANFQVVRHSEDVPMVTIHSNLDVKQRTTTCSQVVLAAEVTLSPCSGDSEVLYEWSTTDPDLPMKTEMIGQPRYVIDKYTLPPGKEVIFTLTVRYKDNVDRSSNAQIILKVARQALKAILKGGNKRVVARGNTDLLFDGSLSYDPDRSSGQLTYTWTCEQDDKKPCYSVKDGAEGRIFPFGSADDGPKLVVCGKHFTAGRRYNISLTVSKDNRASTSTVEILVKHGNVPEVILDPLPSADINEVIDKISLKAYVMSDTDFLAEWTIQDEFGKRLDLSKASFLSIPAGENTYVSLLNIDKVGVVGGLGYSVGVVTTDIMNRTAEARLSGVLRSARITGCVLEVAGYTAYQMITLTTSQCQFSPTSSPLTYQYRVLHPRESERRLSEKIHHPSVRVIGPAPSAGHQTVAFSVEVCSDDDVCGTFFSDPVPVTMMTQRELEEATNAVLSHVSLSERKGRFVEALVNLASFLHTARDFRTDDLGLDLDLVMRFVNRTLTSKPSATALSVLVDQLDVLEPDDLGCPKDNRNVYTELIIWYEANGVSLPYDVHMKINKRLEQIKPGLSEAEYLVVCLALVQATGIGPMSWGQTLDLTVTELVQIRALRTLLDSNVSSSGDSGVTVDFGPELESRYRDWDCGAKSNCNGAIVRFVNYNQSQDPFPGPGSPGYVRISGVVDIQLRNPYTGSVEEVKNLKELVVVRFPVMSRDQFEVTCRYWTGSVWSDVGVRTSQTDDSTVQCSSSHLTAFAVFEDLSSVTSADASLSILDTSDASHRPPSGVLEGGMIGTVLGVVVIATVVALGLRHVRQKARKVGALGETQVSGAKDENLLISKKA